MSYTIQIAPVALEMLKKISDRRLREKLIATIDRLSIDPEKQGKPLSSELSGYRSVRAASQRYRIIYRVEQGRVIVFVLAAGIRKEGSKSDVYHLAKKLLRLGLAEPQVKPPAKSSSKPSKKR